MQDFFLYIKENIWICTLVSAVVALLTFLLNFVFKRKKTSTGTQMISNVSSSTINQAGRDINLNLNKDVK